MVLFIDVTKGRFLSNNYVQALKIIGDYTPLLEEFKCRKSLTDQDFIQWHQEEAEFLSNSAVEPPSDVLAVAYVEELEKLHLAESVVGASMILLHLPLKFRSKYGSVTSVPFLTYTPANFTQTSGLNASARRQSRTVEAERMSALRRYELQMNVVDDFERRNGINERWTTAHPEYTQALQYARERHFIRTVEELEGLVVQRLFEFSKANLAGTGSCHNYLPSLMLITARRLQNAETHFKSHRTSICHYSLSTQEVQQVGPSSIATSAHPRLF